MMIIYNGPVVEERYYSNKKYNCFHEPTPKDWSLFAKKKINSISGFSDGSTSNTINNVPQEIFQLILSHISPSHVITICELVCRNWNKLSIQMISPEERTRYSEILDKSRIVKYAQDVFSSIDKNLKPGEIISISYKTGKNGQTFFNFSVTKDDTVYGNIEFTREETMQTSTHFRAFNRTSITKPLQDEKYWGTGGEAYVISKSNFADYKDMTFDITERFLKIFS